MHPKIIFFFLMFASFHVMATEQGEDPAKKTVEAPLAYEAKSDQKTFVIEPEISLEAPLTWTDVGVTKKENFAGVIAESWKKWAEGEFKDFSQVVLRENAPLKNEGAFHETSVILKWDSSIKRVALDEDKKAARFEITAHYTLSNLKSQEILTAFDFPAQKREISILNTKELSSQLASLVFNLLNSQTAKIKEALNRNKSLSLQKTAQVALVGKHGLSDTLEVQNYIKERFKTQELVMELKSYSSLRSEFKVVSPLEEEALFTLFVKEGPSYPLNEQKVLFFNAENKTFAILPKEANN